MISVTFLHWRTWDRKKSEESLRNFWNQLQVTKLALLKLLSIISSTQLELQQVVVATWVPCTVRILESARYSRNTHSMHRDRTQCLGPRWKWWFQRCSDLSVLDILFCLRITLARTHWENVRQFNSISRVHRILKKDKLPKQLVLYSADVRWDMSCYFHEQPLYKMIRI